jgi:hypothetical protein
MKDKNLELKSIILEAIAEICHEVNKVWCEYHNDFSQKSWKEADDWQKESAINGVRFRLANPDAPVSAMHDNWMREKIEDGWEFDEVKDPEKKTHPCLIPFDLLPHHQRIKDATFCSIVDGMSEIVDAINFSMDKFD